LEVKEGAPGARSLPHGGDHDAKVWIGGNQLIIEDRQPVPGKLASMLTKPGALEMPRRASMTGTNRDLWRREHPGVMAHLVGGRPQAFQLLHPGPRSLYIASFQQSAKLD
jgi:hypothetical protein